MFRGCGTLLWASRGCSVPSSPESCSTMFLSRVDWCLTSFRFVDFYGLQWKNLFSAAVVQTCLIKVPPPPPPHLHLRLLSAFATKAGNTSHTNPFFIGIKTLPPYIAAVEFIVIIFSLKHWMHYSWLANFPRHAAACFHKVLCVRSSCNII